MMRRWNHPEANRNVFPPIWEGQKRRIHVCLQVPASESSPASSTGLTGIWAFGRLRHLLMPINRAFGLFAFRSSIVEDDGWNGKDQFGKYDWE
jgi:hypothetical protein